MRFALVVRSMLFAILLMGVAGALQAQVRVAIRVGPPVIPVYEQPICPGDGYFWTPGNWDYDYDASDYYWVPGTWVEVPLGVRIEKAFGTNSALPLAQFLAPLVGSAEFEKNLVAVADTPSWTIRVMLRWNLPRRKN